jgi:hypothetical protein
MKTRKPSKTDVDDELNVLLDEALAETFPASDPIACTPHLEQLAGSAAKGKPNTGRHAKSAHGGRRGGPSMPR